MDPLDSKYCLRHKEQDHFFSEKYGKWIPKMENKHFHIANACANKYQQFVPSDVEVCLSHTLTANVAAFLSARIKLLSKKRSSFGVSCKGGGNL